MKKILVPLLFTLIPSVSNAMWVAKAEENIFDDRIAHMIGELDDKKSAISLDCNNDDVRLAYVELMEKTDIPPFPTSVLIKVDKNKLIKFSSVIEERTDKSMHVETNDINIIKDLLKQLSTARGKILVGVSFDGTDYRSSYYTDAIGAERAVKIFTDGCGIKL